jgi:hypothetical protein
VAETEHSAFRSSAIAAGSRSPATESPDPGEQRLISSTKNADVQYIAYVAAARNG